MSNISVVQVNIKKDPCFIFEQLLFSFGSISGNFGFQTCSHGDVLGSVLGTGIVRDKLGDIMLQVDPFVIFSSYIPQM